MPTHAFCCYALYNRRFQTYVGITNDLQRRLRQHDGNLTGGSKYTKGKGPWNIGFVVSGFLDKKHALQFEWATKRCSSSRLPKSLPHRSLVRRLQIANKVIKRQRFTTNARPTRPGEYRVLISRDLLSKACVQSTVLDFPHYEKICLIINTAPKAL